MEKGKLIISLTPLFLDETIGYQSYLTQKVAIL